jgi:hypothetical protein
VRRLAHAVTAAGEDHGAALAVLDVNVLDRVVVAVEQAVRRRRERDEAPVRADGLGT